MTAFLSFFNAVLLPFKLLISSVFQASFVITGNYGISLILLSFCITAGTAPLYLLADKWKNSEKSIQQKMSRDIASINKNFTGQKKFYLTKTARRIYGYKSWYAIRTSFGLLIQIPFFFAAYDVLSIYSGFKGISFLFIQDLSIADGLAWGINVLPFVMTFVNIASALYYSRSKSLNDSKELLIMAAVFLLLLYKSPSALLIYWTMNNVFSFIKAIIFRYTGLQKAPVIVTVPAKEPFIKHFPRNEPGLTVFFFYSLSCSLAVFWIVNFKDTFKYCMALTSLSLVAVTIYHLFSKKTRERKTLLAAGWFLLAILFAVFVFFRKYNPYISNPNLKLIIVFLQNLIIANTVLLRIKPAVSHEKMRNRKSDKLALSAILFVLIMFIVVYQPLSYYLSSPADIGLTLTGFVCTIVFVSIAIFASVFCIYLMLSPVRKKKAEELLLFVCFASLLWSVIFKIKTGMLDNLAFQNENAITELHLVFYILDPVVLTILLFFSRRCLASSRGMTISGCIVMSVFLAVASGVRIANLDPSIAVREQVESDALPDSALKNHCFSETGFNVVFVIADMLNGNYIGRLVEQNPEYVEKLAGFVWYPDCLAASYNTATSMPAIFGGEKYNPSLLQDNGKTGLEEIHESAQSFFGSVNNERFRKTVANPVYFNADDTNGANIEDIFSYVNYWKKEHGYATSKSDTGKALLPVLLSVFNSVPWHWKYIVYDDSRWILYRKSAIFVQMRNKAIRDMAYLATLPEISQTISDDRGLFLYLHNELPHSPYGIGINGNPIKEEYPDPDTTGFINSSAAFLSAKKEIDLLCDWFDWMKKNGVYDNTCIVLISDHGNSFNDNGIPSDSCGDPLFGEYDLSRANTLMLVKNYGATGSMLKDSLLVSSADIISYISKSTTIKFPAATAFPAEYSKPRIFSSITGDWESCLDNDTVRFRTYEVTGSIFDGESWKKKN